MSIEDEILSALPMLRGYARSLANRSNQSEDDLVQETVTRALANLDKFKRGTNLHAWLVTICRNEYLSQIRNRRREVEDPDGLISGTRITDDNQTSHQAVVEFLRGAATLPEEQAAALQLVGLLGVTYDEAAEILEVPVGTIKSRVSRARSELRKLA